MATAQQVVDALVRAGRGAAVYRDLPDGLRRAHLYLLFALEELGGRARVTDVAERARVQIPNMTRLLRETDAAGWTDRSPDPDDKRIVLVRLTDEGVACLRRYHWDYLDALGDRLRAQDHPEYDVMIEAIDRAVAAIAEATASVNESEARRAR
ncbi:MarR family transcriptional regulator [Streptomyces sp. NP160]|uniref:MarR family transcriptional regulator n=1 Tax=Streptomyces sp. NP160 TaxID=2586637 RepID=UPI0015D5C096|nr:MarR family transcriptional regulator [Streptomyces sp. NP160]